MFSNPRQQLFQPTATVSTLWWASTFLIEYIDDESTQKELKEGPRSRPCVLDKYYMPDLLSESDFPFFHIFMVKNFSLFSIQA